MRGYLGPIGDDLPSIFPIVFGVVLFIGTMMYAINDLNARNDYLDVRKATLSLSNVVMARGYLPDAYFKGACENDYTVFASREGIKALVTVKKFCPKAVSGAGPLDLGSDIFNVGAASDPYAQQGLWCSSEGKLRNYYSATPKPTGYPTDFVVLNFPVAVDCVQSVGNVKGVGMVNVIGWRR
jgi:hypothetical protein